VDLAESADAATARFWLRSSGARTLNVAGPRESTLPGIYAKAPDFLHSLLG